MLALEEMLIQIDDVPRNVPEVRFLGADSVVIPLKDSLNSNLAAWDRRLWPRLNLETVLGLKFPPPKAKGEDDSGEECAICYCFRLDGVVPEIVCDNPKCARSFHPSCRKRPVPSHLKHTGGERLEIRSHPRRHC